MIYLKLFLAFLQIGLFSVGGGYTAVALIRDTIVENYAWLTMAEFSDLTSIAEMTPGPIALNAATFVGIRIAGFPGALSAMAGCSLPSVAISSLLAFIYYKFKGASSVQSVLKSTRPAVIGLILSAGLTLAQYAVFTGGIPGKETADIINIIIFISSFIVLRKTKLSPIPVIMLSGIIYLALSLISEWALSLI